MKYAIQFLKTRAQVALSKLSHLNNIRNWTEKKKMKLNEEKTKQTIFNNKTNKTKTHFQPGCK